MIYKEYTLPAPLAEHIECVWIFSAQQDEKIPPSQYWLPNGTFDLVFNLGSTYKRINIFDPNQQHFIKKTALIGQMKESVKIELGQCQKVVGVRFKSFGLFGWLGVPLREITGKSVSLQDILGNRSGEWEQMIFEAQNDDQILAVIVSFLKIKSPADEVVKDAVKQILQSKGTLKIKDLAQRYQITQRTLENRFARVVGIQPKELARIYRFNHFLISSIETPRRNFTYQAYECDFFDQSHLIHDFKRITAKTPKHFLKDHSELIEINKKTMKNRFCELY